MFPVDVKLKTHVKTVKGNKGNKGQEMRCAILPIHTDTHGTHAVFVS